MKEGFRKVQLIAMLALLALPPALVLGAHGFAHRLWVAPVFCLICFAAGVISLLIPGKWRVAAGVVMAAGVIAFGLKVLPWREWWWTLAAPLGFAVLLMYMLPIAGWEKDRELSHSLTLAGCGLYMAVQLMNMIPSGVYAAMGPMLKIGFLIYAALWMFALNRQSLIDAAARGQRAPVGMQRRNKVFTVGLMVIVMLIASIPALAHALAWVWNRAVEIAVLIGRWLASLMPETSPGGSGGGGEGMMELAGEVVEPSLFSQIMEKIFAVIAVLALAVALGYALRVVWRKLRVLLGRLWTMLNRYALSASEDYVDEVADTRDTGETSTVKRKPFWQDWFDQVNEERLSPVERIRYRYRRLMRRHAEWQPGSTARENIPREAALLYERARYSSETVSPQEAQAFSDAARELEKK